MLYTRQIYNSPQTGKVTCSLNFSEPNEFVDRLQTDNTRKIQIAPKVKTMCPSSKITVQTSAGFLQLRLLAFLNINI